MLVRASRPPAERPQVIQLSPRGVRILSAIATSEAAAGVLTFGSNQALSALAFVASGVTAVYTLACNEANHSELDPPGSTATCIDDRIYKHNSLYLGDQNTPQV